MSEEDIRELQDRLLADEELRERFRQSPHEVLEEHGIELDEDERQRLHDADLPSRSDDELHATLTEKGLGTLW
jgi:hypothetical protein